MNKRADWKATVLGRSFLLLPQSDRTKMIYAIIVQITISVLDLLGVAAIGLLGALSITGIQSETSTGTVYSVLKILNIESLSFQMGLCKQASDSAVTRR